MLRKQAPLILILFLYLAIASQYAFLTPPWQAPDEPAHYNYIRQLADGQLPIMAPGDYDQAYLDEIRGARFDPVYTIDEIEYEDWQPPLYYLLLTPIYRATGGSLVALRLFSAIIGAGVIILATLFTQRLFPTRPWIPWSTAVLIAFIPQHVAILAAINNDSLAELFIAAILFLILPPPDTWTTARIRWLGLLLGLGFLTKATVYLMAPVIAVALLWHFWGEWRQLMLLALRIFLPALLIGALWWGRNSLVYGGFDLLGKATHDAVVVGQPQTSTWIANWGVRETIRRFLQTTFYSFWGQFGWMAVPMQPWVYRPLLMLVLAAISGLFLRKQAEDIGLPRYPLLLLNLTFLLTAGVLVGYNLTFVQHQGRYLYPALIPIAIALSLGLGRWLNWVSRTLTIKWSGLAYLLPVGLGLGLYGLDIMALYLYILPALSLN